MKIVGKTNTSYITEVTYNEVKAVLSKNDERQRENKYEKLDIGTDLSFTHSLERLTLIKDVKLSGSYRALDILDEAAKEISNVINIVKGIEVDLIKTQQDIIKTGLV